MSWPILAGEIPSPEKLGEGPDPYTPVLTASTTNPNLGANGEATGFWYRSGLWVAGSGRIRMLGTGISVGSGRIIMSLPEPIDTSLVNTATDSTGHVIGGAFFRHTTAASSRALQIIPDTATTVRFFYTGANATLDAADLSATENRIAIHFRYPVQFGV